MFDPKTYQYDCAQLTLGAEKLEEMIAMTENTKKKSMSRLTKTALVAAACVAALVVTAMAAPAIQSIFTSYTITMKDGGSTNVVVPVIQTYNKDGHNYLVVDEETIDITEAMEKDGKFSMETQSGHTVKVTEDGWVSVSGGDVDYSFNPNADATGAGLFAADIPEENLDLGTYTITSGENGAIEVSPAG